MSTSNPNHGVGGTAKDGGLSTAATVADGGPNEAANDSTYVPEGQSSGGPSSAAGTRSKEATSGQAKADNPIDGVGGTAKDGGVSTAATVADGGPDGGEEDTEYKP